MPTKRIKTETLRMREMFEYYYALGPERSLRKVAEKFGVSETSVKRYAISFDWQKRVEQRDIENAKEIEKRTNEFVINAKARYREAIAKLVDEFIRAVDQGKIRIKNILDFERIVRLDMDLMGVGADEHDDNIASLVEALKESGWDKVEDPDKENAEEGENDGSVS